MKRAKCINCGAMINLNDNGRSGKCPYCDTVYLAEESTVQKAINDVVKVVGGDVKNDERPKINWAIAIILLCCFTWVGIVYIIVMASKQKQWDDEHNKQ